MSLAGIARAESGSGTSSTSVIGTGMFGSGKIRTDGVLTFGGQETLFVRGIHTRDGRSSPS
jgi:hypothetical protein